MATYLELCQRARQECGIAGSGPTTVLSQTGDLKRIVDWVNTAWQDIQTREDTWQWMRTGFSVNLTAGQREYTPAQCGITDFASWNIEHIRVYKTTTANEYTLTYLTYDDFREIYMRGAIPSTRPAFFTISPSKSLIFYPTPDQVYTVYGDYYTTPTQLSANTDTPGMPVRFHDLVWYGAMRKYAMFEAANEVYQFATQEYNRLMRNLEQDQLPDMPMAEPLV